MAKAPKKTIISGEHFVVYGGYLLAAAIGGGSWAQAETSLVTKIISRPLNAEAFLPDHIPKSLEPIAEALKAALDYPGERKGIDLMIGSNLLLASGLGSSSSIVVAAIATTANTLGHSLSNEKLVGLALVSEKLIHINPSGIGVNLSIHDSIILFKKCIKLEKIDLKIPTNFIVGFSGTRRKTSTMINRVLQRKNEQPFFFNALINSSSTLSQYTASTLKLNDLSSLGSIMNFYYGLLSWLGLSIPLIDKMVNEAQSRSSRR